MLVHVAKKLLLGRYGADATLFGPMMSMFYADLRRVCANCLAYNTELSELCAQAEKLMAVADRLIHAWIFSSKRPGLELLSDDRCSVTHEVPQKQEKVKCARCVAVFYISGESFIALGFTVYRGVSMWCV